MSDSFFESRNIKKGDTPMRGFGGALCAIGFGALAGTLIALTIDPHAYGWWSLGTLAGGAIAYLVNDYKATCEAIIHVTGGIGHVMLEIGEGMANMFTSLSFWKTVVVCMIAASLVVPTFAAAFFFGLKYLSTVTRLSSIGYAVINYPGAYRAFVGFFIVFVSVSIPISVSEYESNLVELRSTMFKVMKYGNPIALFLYWPIILFVRLIKAIVKVIKLIHSNTRALCFVYATIGAAVGYFVGQNTDGLVHATSPFVGAFAGMALAFVVHRLLPRRTMALTTVK